MSGLLVLGQRRVAVDARQDTAVGWLVADYNWGEAQVISLKEYYKQIGEPKQFEPALATVYKQYDDAKSVWAIRGLINASQMKDVGKQAQDLLQQIQSWASKQGSSVVTPAGVPVAQVVPPPVAPPPKDEGLFGMIPWYVYAVLVAAGAAVVGYFAVPPILSAVAARRLIK